MALSFLLKSLTFLILIITIVHCVKIKDLSHAEHMEKYTKHAIKGLRKGPMSWFGNKARHERLADAHDEAALKKETFIDGPGNSRRPTFDLEVRENALKKVERAATQTHWFR